MYQNIIKTNLESLQCECGLDLSGSGQGTSIFYLIKDWEFVDHQDYFQLLLKNSSPMKAVVLLKVYDQKWDITFFPRDCRQDNTFVPTYVQNIPIIITSYSYQNLIILRLIML